MSSVNKTESIRTRIFKAVLHGDYAPGDKLPTEREMAERTGICRITVRRAYEQLERSGVLCREQGRGTFVATHSRGNQDAGDQIALLTSVGDLFSLEFTRALEKALTAQDMLLVLRLTDEVPEQEEQAAIELVGRGVNNLIVWPSGHSFPEKTFARLRVLGVNLLFFDRMFPGAYADYVGLDNDDAMDSLFAYAEKGALKSPVFVSHSDLLVDSDRARERAFLRNCAARNLAGKIVSLPRQGALAARPEGIHADSVIFCVNDAMAQKLRPVVGNQLLLGIDGLTDKVVSYKQPLAAMANAAVAAMLSQQRKGARWKASKQFFKGELVNG